MDKLYKLGLLGLIAMSTAIASCSEAVDRVSTGGIPFEAYFLDYQGDTRTVGTDAGVISWSMGDKLSLYHTITGGALIQDGAFSINNTASGLATGLLNSAVEEGKSYSWLAVYPYNVASYDAVSLAIGSYSVIQKGNNSMAHMSGSLVPIYGRTTTEGTASPTFVMDQVSSGVKITVKNGTENPLTVSEITFEAPVNIVGTFAADFTGSAAPVLSESSDLSKSVVLTVSGGDAFASGSSAEFFIPFAPCTITSGNSMTITVKAANGASQVFTKTVSSSLAFVSGKLNHTTVSFTEVVPEVAGDPPADYGACPTDAQVAWQRQELIMFCHFGPATFSGVAGDYGTRTADQLLSDYRPSAINTDQWADVAMRNGFGEIILTAKHHDGFCLFDNPYITCDVAGTNTTDAAKIDVVESLYNSCKSAGLKFGIYMSPWDKVDATYGTSEYNTHYNAILSTFMTKYKPDEFWFDGYTGSNTTRMSYDWEAFDRTVLYNNPDCIIFSNEGVAHYPSVVSNTGGNFGCRWVGNEDGEAGETNWSTFNTHASSQSGTASNYETYLSQGDRGGSYWVPAESDLSIRRVASPYGWFWNANSIRKTAAELLDIYYKSVGRNSVMLLNVPPNQAGELDSGDVNVLETFHGYITDIFGTNLISGATVDEELTTEARGYNYKAEYAFDGNENTYWAVSGDNTTSATLVLNLNGTKRFNVISLQEFIKKGQRVKNFTVEYYDGSWKSFDSGTTVGAKRLVKGSTVNASKIRVKFNSLACPLISEIGLYMDDVR